MRDQSVFNEWLAYAKESLRLSSAAKTRADYAALTQRDEHQQSLWERCLAAGWTREEGEQALEETE